jgi:hypothetical protein
MSQNSRIPNSKRRGSLQQSKYVNKKKIGTPPTKIHWFEGALFELRFFQIQIQISVFIVIYGVDDYGK